MHLISKSNRRRQTDSGHLPVRCLSVGVMLCATVAVGAARADKIDDYIKAQMERQHIPGLSLAVLKEGKPVKVKGYGLSNLELNTPATPDSVYKIGSVSKQFIAAGIVLLSKDGKLGLNDTLGKYLEDAPESWRPITLRQVLTHTAGLMRDPPGFDPLKVQSDIDVIRSAYSAPLSYPPGAKWDYSNVGYYVLAEIITRASQKPWSQYLQERLFAPLGMNVTRPTTQDDLVFHRASGYGWTAGKYENAQLLLGVRPSGAFLSTVRDLGKWDATLYTDKLFTAEEREALWTPVKISDGTEKPYGFGWRIEKVGTHRQAHHAGTLPGFRAQIARFVDDGLSVVVLANATQATPEKIALGVAAFYISDLFPKRKAAKVPAAVLEGYAGQYKGQSGPTLTLTHQQNGKLLLTMALGQTTMDLGLLIPESDSRFFNEDDPRNTYVFSPDAQGQMQFAIENEAGKQVQKATKVSAPK